jgi:hypothetical protein
LLLACRRRDVSLQYKEGDEGEGECGLEGRLGGEGGEEEQKSKKGGEDEPMVGTILLMARLKRLLFANDP